jgi:hypothetical protein
MSNFPGGSVYSMVQSILSGVFLVTERSFKRLEPGELQQLGLELEKQLRTIRGEQAPIDDTAAIQDRQRRIQRLNSALNMMRAHQMKRKPGR